MPLSSRIIYYLREISPRQKLLPNGARPRLTSFPGHSNIRGESPTSLFQAKMKVNLCASEGIRGGKGEGGRGGFCCIFRRGRKLSRLLVPEFPPSQLDCSKGYSTEKWKEKADEIALIIKTTYWWAVWRGCTFSPLHDHFLFKLVKKASLIPAGFEACGFRHRILFSPFQFSVFDDISYWLS